MPDLTPDDLRREHEQGFAGRPARIQRCREALREYAGVEVPRRAAAVEDWYAAKKGVITRRLNERTADADSEPENDA